MRCGNRPPCQAVYRGEEAACRLGKQPGDGENNPANVIHNIQRDPEKVRLDSYMDRAQLIELLDDLQATKKEKAWLEEALRQAGLSDLVA